MIANNINQAEDVTETEELAFSKQLPSYREGEISTTEPATILARQHDIERNYYVVNDGVTNDCGFNAHTQSSVQSFDQLKVSHGIESLAIEAAVAIVINGIHYAILMASPSELEYFALGFLYSEGLIQSSQELLDWEITQLSSDGKLQSFIDPRFEGSMTLEMLQQQLQDYDAYIVELTLSQRRHQQIQAQRRLLSGRTGCGMCGMTGLKQALPDLSGYKQHPAAKPELDILLDLSEQLTEAQQTHQLTGAVHGAATLYNGKLKIFEDVGRHNALDKMVGWQLRHKAQLDYIVMTSRLSIELVQKAIRCRLPWLVGISAPTSTAVRVAKRHGLGLAGFLRENRITFYT